MKRNPDYTSSETDAYNEGYSFCSSRPRYFPRCPYPDDDDPRREAWFQGADDAGRMKVYTNGVYTGEAS